MIFLKVFIARSPPIYESVNGIDALHVESLGLKSTKSSNIDSITLYRLVPNQILALMSHKVRNRSVQASNHAILVTPVGIHGKSHRLLQSVFQQPNLSIGVLLFSISYDY